MSLFNWIFGMATLGLFFLILFGVLNIIDAYDLANPDNKDRIIKEWKREILIEIIVYIIIVVWSYIHLRGVII